MAENQPAPSADKARPLLVGSPVPALTYATPEGASGETHHQLPVPAVFVLGTDGKIRFEHVTPDHKSRRDSDVLLAMARAALKK